MESELLFLFCQRYSVRVKSQILSACPLSCARLSKRYVIPVLTYTQFNHSFSIARGRGLAGWLGVRAVGDMKIKCNEHYIGHVLYCPFHFICKHWDLRRVINDNRLMVFQYISQFTLQYVCLFFFFSVSHLFLSPFGCSFAILWFRWI